LGGSIPLVVAAPEDAREAFGALERQYPFLWYRGETLSAPALLATLLRAYDDYPARLAALDLPGLLGEVARRGHISVVEAQAALHSYTRDEVAATVEALAQQAAAQGDAAPEWLEGLGLCAPAWLDALATAARGQVEAAGGRLPLAALGASDGALAGLAEASLEALALRAGLLISRASLFAAEALTPERAESDAADAAQVAQKALADAATKGAATTERPQRMSRRAQPRKGLRRTSSGVTWNAPTMFPPELAGDEDAADPLTPTQADE
jgi:hypothetical protein